VQPGLSYIYLLVEEKEDGTLVEYQDLTVIIGVGFPDTQRLFLPFVINEVAK